MKHLGSDFEKYIKILREFSYKNEEYYVKSRKELKDKISEMTCKYENNLKNKRELELISTNIDNINNKLKSINISSNVNKDLIALQDNLEHLHDLKIDYIHYTEILNKSHKINEYKSMIEKISEDIEITHIIYEK